ncbi:hypothetical protein P168DRAFT_288781 [Aspergillus campestris IBT 28561]|uniref:LITAF domain-containing protein n=1 Tax=Aspergillus campestris (strain IBT 28561) TaxID=1392248 RepID=A0A2I1DAJ1_ASPC2|nr:uncharacterized protein P168DRAFT_288781 [Aspergillus campestris IBT 28561]PKY06884.1 hypothetical protein P168DRAFT_288781 [Aspergillus campestris IBT 28561]
MTILRWVLMSLLGCCPLELQSCDIYTYREQCITCGYKTSYIINECSATKIMVIGILSLPGVGFFGARLSFFFPPQSHPPSFCAKKGRERYGISWLCFMICLGFIMSSVSAAVI